MFSFDMLHAIGSCGLFKKREDDSSLLPNEFSSNNDLVKRDVALPRGV